MITFFKASNEIENYPSELNISKRYRNSTVLSDFCKISILGIRCSSYGKFLLGILSQKQLGIQYNS